MAGQGRRKSGGTVTQECIQELLDFFIKNAYKARNVDQRVRDPYPASWINLIYRSMGSSGKTSTQRPMFV